MLIDSEAQLESRKPQISPLITISEGPFKSGRWAEPVLCWKDGEMLLFD